MADFILPIVSGLAGLFGGGKQSQTNTNSSGTQNVQTSNTNTSTPNLSPYQKALADIFTKGATNLFGSSTNLSPYATAGGAGIAGQGAANSQIIQNILAQRGQSYSPSAINPMVQNTLNTGNQMNQFMSQIPLLQRQLQTSGLDELMKAFQVLPTGSTTTGSGSSNTQSQQTGQSQQYGNPLGGLFGGLGAGLAAPINGAGDTGIGSILNALGIGGPNYGPNGYVSNSTVGKP